MSRDADRFELLTAVGEVADAPLLLGETVQRLLDIIVPSFADVATLDVVSATGEMRRLGARVDRPRDHALESAILTRHQSGDSSVGVLKVAATGESQLISPVTEDTLSAIATSDEDLAMLRDLRVRSTIYVPLSARGRTLGVLACSTRATKPTFTAADLRLAEALGTRIGLALDNAGLSATVSGLERQLEMTLANLAAGVIVRDGNGRLVFVNPAAAELLGLESVEAFFSTTPDGMMERFDAYDDQGRSLSLAELPSGRAMRGEQPPPMIVRSVRRRDGHVRWVLQQATPVFDADGSLSLVVNVLEDVSAAKRAELAQRLLSEASRELFSSLDYEQTLARVAKMAVPDFADWCGVSILGAGEVLEQVAVAHMDPDKVELARQWGARRPTRLGNPSGAAEVMRTGQSLMIEELTDEVLAAMSADAEQLSLVRDLEMRSVIIVPLAVPGREPFGTLSLVMAESGRGFARHDLTVAEELGRRAAMAVENARLYTERSRIATVLQRSLLPAALPEVPGLRLASLYRPAGEDNEVGGDFYDVFPVSGGWMVVVGDVTGHGAEAAALTALSRHTLRTAAQLLGDPVAAVKQLNRTLIDRHQLSLVSLCCVMLRVIEGEASAGILLAGHPPPYHVRAGGVEIVGVAAQLLGLDDAGRWTMAAITLEPGDLLVLYTDGVVDTFGEQERFGETRLAEALREASDAPDAIRRIDTALAAFAQGAQRDDTAVLAIQRVAVPGPTDGPLEQAVPRFLLT